MIFLDRLKKGPVLFDGAMGTQIQAFQPTLEEWDNKIGCSEVLNLTVPDKIQAIHEGYLKAGCDVVETNTFGANIIVLSEYDLQDRVLEINKTAVEIARKAVEKYNSIKPRYIAGSIGPGTKLVSLGQTDFDTMYHSYQQQVQSLVEGGVDLLVVETCQDLLQIKVCLAAITDTFKSMNVRLPIAVSVTVESTGTLLVGSEITAVLSALAPFDVDILGMNCATGPEHMRPYIKEICRQFPGAVLCQPNAGLPENVDGELVYTLKVEDFVKVLTEFIEEDGVQIVGGCCGTTPDFMAQVSKQFEHIQPAVRSVDKNYTVSSLFSEKNLHQQPGPFFVGERANTNGSKKFRDYLLKEDWDGIVDVAREQQNTGAHALDLCVAYTGRNETADMENAVKRIVTQIDLPIVIDSTDAVVIEKALKLTGGRAVINSINLEAGEDKVHEICRLAKRYGAALIALTIDEQGMALEVDRKVEIAKRLHQIAVDQHGLHPQDLIFDALTFTLGSGDESLMTAGINTVEGIRKIKSELPGVFTILGVSNISFGLSPYSREVLNSVFLDEAVKAGLDLAIVNVKKIMPLYQIDQQDIDFSLDLVYNRGENPLISFIKHFEQKAGVETKNIVEDELDIDEKIKHKVIQGNRSGLETLLLEKLEQISALDIVNELLIPAMKVVGELFGAGKMQLPFVLQAAEVMKFSVDKLKPYMEKTDDHIQKSIVLATVRGDVHDIGKNLVDIILSNNGYKVYNLGIKCEIDTILQKAKEVHADAIGMSGLLVKSTVIMKENLEEMQKRNIHIPVLLGGAALTKSYVDDVCNAVIDSPVLYCSDAFEGLRVMEAIKENNLNFQKSTQKSVKNVIKKPAVKVKEEIISQDIEVPEPPFWNSKIVSDIKLETVFEYITETVLFRGRWGYKKGKLSTNEYEKLLNDHVRPEYKRLKTICIEQNLLAPQVVYGYYPCNSDGDDVVIYHPNTDKEWTRFHFPRQKQSPFRCIADFFLPVKSGRKDVIALQVATVGHNADQESKRLYESDSYKDYLQFYGLSVEAAESLAEYWHKQIRLELGIADQDGNSIDEFVLQKYRGSRYSFGYPACPDLAENRKLFQLLDPGRIGVSISDEDQMVPEQTTSAFIVHHPQAKYFRAD